MPRVYWPYIANILRRLGHNATDEILYSKPSETPFIDEPLSNRTIVTTCAYGMVTIRFNKTGGLSTISVGDSRSIRNTVDYGIAKEMLWQDFRGPVDWDEIIYTLANNEESIDIEPDFSVRGESIYAFCNYGGATIIFDDPGRIELIEIC
jgi:hypothetical protein